MKKKVLIITGARSEYGLLKPVFLEMQKSKKIEPLLLVTGMHTLKKHGYTVNEVKNDGIPIAHVASISEDDDMLSALASEITSIKKYCIANKPNLILVNGDRDESFAGAIVSGHLKIPLGHIHGGDVTGFVVDEYIRHATTKFAHLHFTASPASYRRVLKLGEEKWRVFCTGSTGLDRYSDMGFLPKEDLAKKYNLNLNKKWFLVIHHPTPLDKISIKQQINPLLASLADSKDTEKIVIYPNSDMGSKLFIKEINRYKNRQDFHIYPNVSLKDHASFMKNVNILIGNSSSGIIEAAYFKLPVVNIGNRQRGRERDNNVINCAYDRESIEKSITLASSAKFVKDCKKIRSLYKSGASKKIVKIIEQNIDKKNLFLKEFTYSKI
ncbi:MAG: UDP-N-acetylglucosamine 2-epimerase (hydrolyzing) [Candidatus Yanofskybacteria bacterium]|nr:UDP-N-acetylglucosamine 2-epimerase (hydrolyzing) [Candidatus Yanofskybacteria bacterium]